MKEDTLTVLARLHRHYSQDGTGLDYINKLVASKHVQTGQLGPGLSTVNYISNDKRPPARTHRTAIVIYRLPISANELPFPIFLFLLVLFWFPLTTFRSVFFLLVVYMITICRLKRQQRKIFHLRYFFLQMYPFWTLIHILSFFFKFGFQFMDLLELKF